MANFKFIESKEDLKAFAGFRMAEIDGEKARTMKEFFGQIARALDFPEEFDHSLESLDDLLNDLSWLEEDRILLFISHSDAFLSQEKNRDKITEVFNLLDITAEDWKWVDDEVEAESPREFVILIEPSQQLTTLFDQEGIAYEPIA
ncbi:barstar family protein [Larkinella soli]|uniref:barstar family protein n=1 Tax=Larkinella soli TaxID=1770527 RepID=UPI000FFC075C|nr:barstar family protein [Larkinella soli]